MTHVCTKVTSGTGAQWTVTLPSLDECHSSPLVLTPAADVSAGGDGVRVAALTPTSDVASLGLAVQVVMWTDGNATGHPCNVDVGNCIRMVRHLTLTPQASGDNGSSTNLNALTAVVVPDPSVRHYAFIVSPVRCNTQSHCATPGPTSFVK